MGIVKESLPDKVYTQLKKDILSGKIPTGSRLTLRDLKDYLGVSITPIREALNRLAQEHFIEYTANQGVRVVTLQDQDIRQLLEICSMYDCYMVEQVMSLPEAEREKAYAALEETIAAQRHIRMESSHSNDDYSEVCYGFHNTLALFAGNPWLAQSARQFNGLLFLADSTRSSENYPSEAIEEHAALLDAMRAGKLEEAVHRAKLHRQNELSRFLENKRK